MRSGSGWWNRGVIGKRGGNEFMTTQNDIIKEIQPSFGTTLRTARETLNLSLREVEDVTGISNAYISQLESDKIRQTLRLYFSEAKGRPIRHDIKIYHNYGIDALHLAA